MGTVALIFLGACLVGATGAIIQHYWETDAEKLADLKNQKANFECDLNNKSTALNYLKQMQENISSAKSSLTHADNSFANGGHVLNGVALCHDQYTSISTDLQNSYDNLNGIVKSLENSISTLNNSIKDVQRQIETLEAEMNK